MVLPFHLNGSFRTALVVPKNAQFSGGRRSDGRVDNLDELSRLGLIDFNIRRIGAREFPREEFGRPGATRPSAPMSSAQAGADAAASSATCVTSRLRAPTIRRYRALPPNDISIPRTLSRVSCATRTPAGTGISGRRDHASFHGPIAGKFGMIIKVAERQVAIILQNGAGCFAVLSGLAECLGDCLLR